MEPLFVDVPLFGRETLVALLGWYLVFIVSTTLHEAGHAWAALRLGDPTAYYGGQVTIHPGPHIQREPIGTVVVPIVSFFLYGGRWMIGFAHAPYDPQWAARYPGRAAVMAMAGPAANLLLAVVAFGLIKWGLAAGLFERPEENGFPFDQLVAAAGDGWAVGASRLVSILFTMNLILLVFNLMPFPPLDGSALVELVLSRENAVKYRHFLSQPAFAIVGLIVAWNLFPSIFVPVFDYTVRLLYGGG